MNEKEKLIPQRRFKEFKNTGTWEHRTLGDITEVITKGTTPLDKSWKGPVNYVKTDSIDSQFGHIIVKANTSIEEHERYLKRSQLKAGDVLFSIVGTLGRVGIVQEKDLPANTNQQIAIIRLNKGDNNYVFNALKTSRVAEFIKSDATIGAQPSLSLWQIEKLIISYPGIKEQIQIGNFFNQLDNTIALYQCKLDKAKSLKSAYLLEMFPAQGERKPKRRFAGFTDDWKQRELGDIADVIDPHPSHRAPEKKTVGIPFVGIGDVDEEGNINYSSVRIVDETIYDEHYKRYDLKKKSIGIGRVASLGKIIRLRNDVGKYAISPTMAIIQFDIGVKVDYMYSYMNTPIFQKQFASYSSGSTRQSVGIQDLRKLVFYTPVNVKEQELIGVFFQNLDHSIALHQHKLEKLKNIKQAYLNELFV